MRTVGACFCGSVKYKADIDPNMVGICHCRDCQIFGGSAFRTSCIVTPENFSFTEGEPRFFEKRADSGAVRRMAFCESCGTHLCSLPGDEDAEDAFISIRIATSEDFGQLKPIAEIFCDSRVSWLDALKDTIAFPRMPG